MNLLPVIAILAAAAMIVCGAMEWIEHNEKMRKMERERREYEEAMAKIKAKRREPAPCFGYPDPD
jgi:hypothetical protein